MKKANTYRFDVVHSGEENKCLKSDWRIKIHSLSVSLQKKEQKQKHNEYLFIYIMFDDFLIRNKMANVLAK